MTLGMFLLAFVNKEFIHYQYKSRVFFVSEIADSLSSADKMFRLYDGVETFVLFIGYPRSCHSLVGAILDAHPEIIIPHEYNILAKLKKLQEQKQTKEYMKKYFLFHNLHMLSHDQALFGFRANDSLLIEKKFTYTYNVPGLWQGDFDKRIKVKAHIYNQFVDVKCVCAG